MTNKPLVPNSNNIPQRIQLTSSDLSDGPIITLDTITPISDAPLGNAGSNGKSSDSGHVHPFPSQTTATHTTGTVAVGSSISFSLTTSKRISIDKISCNAHGWFRLYNSQANMNNDATRAQNTLPSNTNGCAIQAQFTGSISSVTPSVSVQVSNSDTPRSNVIWISILNNNISSHIYTIIVTYHPEE